MDTNYGTTASVLLNQGSGTFGTKVDYTTGSSPASIAVVDVNGDGKPDIVTANHDANTASVLLGICSGIAEAGVSCISCSTNQLETAIKDGDVEIVEKLVPFITDIDAKNRFLQVAVANCQSVIAGFFITSGADVNAKYPDEDFPLHKASRCKAANTTQVLLDAKAQIADVNAVNKKGNTALHIAARYGCKDVVEELLGHEANVHAKNKFGDTALHHAAHWDHKDIVEILLDHHARVEEPNHADQTALMLAIRGGTPDTMKPLVAAMTKSRSWQEEADFANIAGYGDIAQAIESNIAGGVKSDEL